MFRLGKEARQSLNAARTQAGTWLDRKSESPSRSEGNMPVRISTPRIEQEQEEEPPTERQLSTSAPRFYDTAMQKAVQQAQANPTRKPGDLTRAIARLTEIKERQRQAEGGRS